MEFQNIAELPESIMTDLALKGFKVKKITGNVNPPHTQGRRDFYKIVLVTGDMTIYYGDRTIDVKGTFLFFANPHVPHSVVDHSVKRTGYACLFTEAFIAGREGMQVLQNSPLFRFGSTPVVRLDDEQGLFVTGLFQKMLALHADTYNLKEGAIRSCIELIIHEAMHIQPPHNELLQKNAATRIAGLFLELLERQFPIESTGDPLKLRTAQDYAKRLSVHVNYLNRSVKEVTGRQTSVLIAERIAAEAKALLQHTDWSVADVAYGLGFEYPTYFNNYFKRVTGFTPQAYRKSKV